MLATDKDITDFRAAIRKAREGAGLSKRDLAEKAGVSYKHYFNIEQGVTGFSLMAYISICRALGIKNFPLIG